MEQTEFTFKIPELLKKQVRLGLGSFRISYYGVDIDGAVNEVHKAVEFSLTCNNKMPKECLWGRETLSWKWDDEGSQMDFEDFFDEIRNSYNVVGDKI